MPSGPKKRRASRRKLAEGELVLSTAGATDRCIGSMVSNDAVQLSQQVEEHVTDVVPSTESPDLKELNVAVPVCQQVEEHVSDTLIESEIMGLPNGDIGGDMPKEVFDVVACETCLSEVAVENETGSMKTDVAAEESNVAVDSEDGNVLKGIDITKSNEGVVVPEVVSSEVGVESSDGIVVGAAQLASKKDSKEIQSFSIEGKDSLSLNGSCMSMAQVDNSHDVGLNVKEPSAGVGDGEENVFDVMPLKKLNDDVQVEEHECNMNQESVLLELLNDKQGNMSKENECFNCLFSVPNKVMSGVEVSGPVVAAVQNDIGSDVKLASKKDEKDSDLVASKQLSQTDGGGVDSALTGSFPKLLDLIQQIEHLVQEAKALMAQQKGEI